MNSDLRTYDSARSITDAELELLLDGALSSVETERVEHAIAASPADAARLAAQRDADERIREALLATPAPAERRTHSGVGLRWVLAAAAMLMLTGVVGVLLSRGGATAEPRLTPGPSLAANDAPVSTYEPVRVIFSIKAAKPDPASKDRAKPAVAKSDDTRAPVSPTANAMAVALLDASGVGIRRAVTAINDASPEDRAAALATLGQTLRSGSTAVRILDRLGPRDQVAVCGELALDSALRAVALQRLRDLTDNPEVGADARAAVRVLAAAPGMKPWLRSYGLLEADPPKPASLERESHTPATG